MTKKRVLSVVLALAMLGMTACGNAEKSEAVDNTLQSGAAESVSEGDDGEVVTLTYWAPINAAASKYVTSYSENTAYQEVMERLGIKIEFIHPAVGQEQEEFNLLFLGDKLPDIIAYADHYVGGEFQGMRDGVFQDITELAPEYAPDYYKILQMMKNFTGNQQIMTDIWYLLTLTSL